MVSPDTLLALFDLLPDVVFFVKDREGRYTHANVTLRKRLCLRGSSLPAGKTAVDLFPEPLGLRYLEQDLRVIQSGRPIIDELERHLFPDHAHGWCLTRKIPLLTAGKVTGLIGISRDLRASASRGAGLDHLGEALKHAQRHLAEPLSVREMAKMAGLSVAQLERHLIAMFQLTPQQWLLSKRLERAMKLIATDGSIAFIAGACGFADHSAFTRAFRRHVGLAPSEYRQLLVTLGAH